MIVCVCHRVSDRHIQQAIQNGADSVDALSVELGACTSCGCCRESCQQLIDQHVALGSLPIAA